MGWTLQRGLAKAVTWAADCRHDGTTRMRIAFMLPSLLPFPDCRTECDVFRCQTAPCGSAAPSLLQMGVLALPGIGSPATLRSSGLLLNRFIHLPAIPTSRSPSHSHLWDRPGYFSASIQRSITQTARDAAFWTRYAWTRGKPPVKVDAYRRGGEHRRFGTAVLYHCASRVTNGDGWHRLYIRAIRRALTPRAWRGSSARFYLRAARLAVCGLHCLAADVCRAAPLLRQRYLTPPTLRCILVVGSR